MTLILVLSSVLYLAAAPAAAQVPFACTGEAFIEQNINAQLTQVNQSVSPFVFDPIGPPAGIEYNNLGFRRTDGLLYAVQLLTAGNSQIIQVDSTGAVFGLGRPAGGTLPTNPRFDAGDVSPDGNTMYITTVNQPLFKLDLGSWPGPGNPLPAVTSTAITGSTGNVFDWAVNPVNGLLYGGDSTGGQIARLDPTTGVRIDVTPLGCTPVSPTCTATSLPSGTAFGGAWFNAAGRLFIYQNSGTIFEIDLDAATPTIVSTQGGPGSVRNDGAACVQDLIGSAKQMTLLDAVTPATLQIDYVFENLSLLTDLFNLSAPDDLSAVFGVEGTDWLFSTIFSSPASFANPTFNGDTDIELINQLPTQSLLSGSSATVTVQIEILTLDNLNEMGQFCNQVLATGETADGGLFGDLSTDGTDPDPNGDGSPDERSQSCVDLSALVNPAIQLIKNGTLDLGPNGVADPGDLILYTFDVTNTGNVTLTNVTVSDPLVSPIDCSPLTNGAFSLAPGETTQCTGSYAITQADIDAGQRDNTATATGTDPGGNPVTDTDSHIEPIQAPPVLTLQKTVTTAGGTCPGVEVLNINAGDTVKYCYSVTNSGGGAAFNVTLVDDAGTPGVPGDDFTVTLTGLTDEDGDTLADDLAAGATATGEALVTINVTGTVVNTATVTGEDGGGNPVTDSDTATVVSQAAAALAVQKTVTTAGGTCPGIEVLNISVGDTVKYCYTVTNSGGGAAFNVTLVDDAGTPGAPGDDFTVTLTGLTDEDADTLADDLAGGATATGEALVTITTPGTVTNTATVTGQDGGGNPLTDSDTATVTSQQQTPFVCTGEAYIVQDINAQLSLVDQTVSPFAFIPIGGPAGIEYNNLGFRVTDGLLYAVELNANGNTQIVQIDANGVVTGLGRPAGGSLPTTPRFDAGDVTPDGTTMYITSVNQPLYKLDLTTVPVLPAVTSVAITGATGFVFDWAVNPANGLLYGGDKTDGQLAVLDPVTGVRTDFNVPGLPAGTAFGGSWFDAAGSLYLYRNNGEIYEIDLTGPSIASVQTGPGSVRNDAAACIQDVVGAAKQMTVTTGSLPDTVTIEYTFENFSTIQTIFNLSALDNLQAVFGIQGVDWTFTSISSTPAAFANPAFNGSTNFELINQAPTQSLPPGATATVTVVLDILTLAELNLDGQFCNQVLFTAETAGGIIFGDQSTSGTDPDPNGDGSPGEDELACIGYQVPFVCPIDPLDQGLVVQNIDAQLESVDQAATTFTVTPIGSPAGIEYNNLGFRVTDGLLYAVELNASGNTQIVQIDSNGVVLGLGRPAGLPTGPRFDAGGVTPDGTTMYINTVSSDLYVLDLTSLPALPPVTQIPVSGARGFVFDWAVNPADGRLYGGDSTQGQLAVLDPITGVRTDFNVSGLPRGEAFGAAWFSNSGLLYLYRNSGTIYEVDVASRTILATRTGPGSSRNDGTSCIVAP